MATAVKKKRGRVSLSTNDGAATTSSPLISDAKLKQLYSTMLQCQILKERAYPSSKSSSKTARHAGGEAVAVGAAIDLRRNDWLAPFTNEELGRFIKGVPLESILSGVVPGKPAKRSASKIAPTPLKEEPSPSHILPRGANPAAQLNLASGIALASQAKKSSDIVMTFFGDISGAGQRWYEALAFAGRHCLPLLVVVQSKASDLASRGAKGNPLLSFLGEGACAVPVIPVDAEDVVAIYRVACESIHKARYRGGPTLIQAVSLVGLQDTEAASPRRSGAITKMETYLAAKGLFSAAWKQQLIDNFNRDVESALKAGKKRPSPNRE